MSIIDQPFRIAPNGDVHSAAGIPLFVSELEQIIMTSKAGHGHEGELAWDTEFGSLVPELLHNSDSDNTKRSRIRQYIREAVSYYPSYKIKTITIDIEEVNGAKKVTATLIYDEDGIEKNETLNLA